MNRSSSFVLLNGGSVDAGSSSYGSTGATVNGNVNVLIGGTVDIGASGSNGAEIGGNVGASVQSISCSSIGFAEYLTAWHFCQDTAGNVGITGNVTAANFYTGSRRAWKKDIAPYTFDPLALLGRTDFKQYECKTNRCGPVGMKKVGIIADDSPSEISGKHHDHYDGFAMAAIDGAAIVELDHRVAILGGIIAVLVVWCLGLTIVLVRRA